MAFANEFDTQWNSVTAYLESEMIKQSDSKNGINLQDIEQKFENEKKRWSVPGQFNCAWHELLKKKNPTVAEAFLTALERAHFKQVQVEQPTSSATIISTIGCAAIGYCISALMNQGILFASLAAKLANNSVIFSGLVTIVGGAIGGVVGNSFTQKKKTQINADLREQYVKQLREIQSTLRAIVQGADD